MQEQSTTAGDPSSCSRLWRVSAAALCWATAMVLVQMVVAPFLWLASVVVGAPLPISVWSMTVGAFTKPAAGIGQWIAVTALVIAASLVAPADDRHSEVRDGDGDERAAGVPGETGDR